MKNLFTTLADVIITAPGVPDVTPSDSTIGNVMSFITGVAAGVAILIIAIGSLKLIISRGNPEALNKARDTIIYALVGFVISAAAFVIVTFVVESI